MATLSGVIGSAKHLSEFALASSVVPLAAAMWRVPLGGLVECLCREALFSGGAGRAPRQFKVPDVLTGGRDWVGEPGFKSTSAKRNCVP